MTASHRRWAMALGRALILLVLLAPLASTMTACGGGIQGRTIKVHASGPANVVVVFQLQAVDNPLGSLGSPLHIDEDRGPVARLGEENFRVFEDDFRVELGGEGFITNTDLRSGQRIVLLLDLGAAISPEHLGLIADATQKFLEQLSKQRIAIFAFDGSKKLHRITRMTTPDRALKSVERIRGFDSKDSSTNLRGAFALALEKLRNAVRASDHMFGSGVLVLVSRGPDRASRITPDDLSFALEDEELELVRLVVGVGERALEADLGPLATWDPVQIGGVGELASQMADVADRIDAYGRSYYVLSYCSPARSDMHHGRIEVSHAEHVDGELQERTGSVDFEFDADGFKGGCKPQEVPEELLPAPPQEAPDG